MVVSCGASCVRFVFHVPWSLRVVCCCFVVLRYLLCGACCVCGVCCRSLRFVCVSDACCLLMVVGLACVTGNVLFVVCGALLVGCRSLCVVRCVLFVG